MGRQDVLVTGAGGFIGRALSSRLAALGVEFTGVGRGPRPDDYPGAWYRCDLSDATSAQELIKKTLPRVVYHLAGSTLGHQGKEAVWPTLRDNVVTTLSLLMALVDTDCRRVVLTASLRDPGPASDFIPTSPYAASKAVSSAYARMFHLLYAVPVTIARPFMVYGPGPQDMSKLVPFVASRLIAGESAALSSGDAAFDFVYIDDVVEGLLALSEKEGVEGKTIDLGSGHLTSVADVAMAIANRLGRSHLLSLGALPDRRLEPERVADVSSTSALTNWTARVPLSDGIERFLAWCARRA